jgi:hypothetical protein
VGKVTARFGDEFLTAAGAAEDIALALMFGGMFGAGRIDAHAADRVFGERSGRKRVAMTGMVMAPGWGARAVIGRVIVSHERDH